MLTTIMKPATEVDVQIYQIEETRTSWYNKTYNQHTMDFVSCFERGRC
jgi:hypothetical protein